MDESKDFISFLAFLAEQDKITLNNNIEVNSRRISELLLHENNDLPIFYVKILQQITKNDNLILNGYKIFIHEKWMLTITLLASLRHNKYISNQKLSHESCQDDIKEVMIHILNNLKISEVVTIQLLILLEMILKKHSDILDETLCINILKNMNNIALCPISKFKYYAHCISKIVLKYIPKKCLTDYDNLHYLPIRGIETSDLVKVVFDEKDFDVNLVKKCIRLFQNNLDSKDGSFLYEFLINCDFEFWREKIWLYFKESFENIKLEGEYFQSLVKYWIPLNIKRYQEKFYDFLLTQNINFTLEALIYFELKKQTFNNDNTYDQNMLKYFKNNETKDIVLKTFIFKSFKPRLWDLNALKYYLFSTTDVLNDFNQKTLRQIFSHLFLYGNNLARKNINTDILEDFLVDLYKFICSLFTNMQGDFAAQLLLIVLNSAKMPAKKLILSYTPEKLDFYEENGNLLYEKMLKNKKWHFEDQQIIDYVKFWFLKTEGVNDNITQIILNYFIDNIKIECGDILNIVEKFSKNTNLQSCEKIKNYAKICQIKNLDKIMDLQTFLYNNNFIVCDEYVLFKSVLFMEIILACTEKNVQQTKIDYFLKKSVEALDQLLNEEKFKNITNRTTKILETFINNLLILIKTFYKNLPNHLKAKILNLLVKIIQISNMKKPVTMSVEVLKYLGTLESNFDKNANYKLMASTLEQIIFSPEKLNVKIRRNPETRLVLHALATSENHPNKPLLFWCIEFLMGVLRDENSSDSALTSAFHCLEIIVSDNTIQRHTMKYVPEIIEHTVLLYKNPSWSVRNGLIQMVKAIIERFFGVYINMETRPKTIEDLFVIFPTLSTFFQHFLNQPNFTPSHVIIFLYFSESKFRDQIFQNPEVIFTRLTFLTAFFQLANSVTGYYGNQVSLSIVSMTSDRSVPIVFEQIVSYVVQSRCKCNILRNYLIILEELYFKYKNSFECSINCNMDVIDEAIEKLLSFLSCYNVVMFDLLLFKINSVENVLKVQKYKSSDNYFDRIWFHNNIPFIFQNIDGSKITQALNFIDKNIPDCIQVKILSILLDRVKNNHFDDNVISNIICKLVLKFMLTDDTKKYLSCCYFKTILALYESCNFDIFDINLQQFYKTNNFYKIMTLNIILSKKYTKNDIDYKFINNSVTLYEQNLLSNEDIAYTLFYLYKNLNNNNFKISVLKIAIYLLLKTDYVTDICNFICLIANIKFTNTLQIVSDFYTCTTLLSLLNEKNLVGKFLNSSHEYFKSLECDFIESDTFYLVQNDVSIPKIVLIRIVRRCIVEYMHFLK